MNGPQPALAAIPPHTTLIDKLARLTALSLTVVIFLKAGWYLLRPADPQGAVSFLSTRLGAVAALECLALSAGCAAIVTVLTGRRLAYFGCFAVAVALVLVSLRGATSAHLLLRYAEPGEAADSALALRFAVESLVWSAVLLAVMLTCVMVRHRLADGPSIVETILAPGFKTNLIHTGLATLVGLLAVRFFSTGLSSRSIQHGQSCFVVAAGIGIATYVARRAMPVRTEFWSLLAVPLIAFLAYAWASIRPAIDGLPTAVPSSHFMRILPIQFLAVGVASVLGTIWYFPTADNEKIPPETK